MRIKFDNNLIKNIITSSTNIKEFNITRAGEGMSTSVYKIISKEGTFYLRIAGYKDENIYPEVMVHKHILQFQSNI